MIAKYVIAKAGETRGSRTALLVGQAVLELLIKTIVCMFWSISQEQLAQLKF